MSGLDKYTFKISPARRSNLKWDFVMYYIIMKAWLFSKDFHAPLNSQLDLKDVFKKLYVTTV